jgi:pimeloyl-ACP methyl ester carboxylesterase
MVSNRSAQVDGLNVFYREAGDPASPKLLLLGGFPASSHQFRNLIPALADRFHVLSPDYPGFGNTDMPDDFEYTFDRLSEIVEGLLEHTGFHPFGLYHQDYGGPIGNRIVGRHPDWLEWQVIQNSNAYEEGFTTAWDGFATRSGSTAAPRPKRRSLRSSSSRA